MVHTTSSAAVHTYIINQSPDNHHRITFTSPTYDAVWEIPRAVCTAVCRRPSLFLPVVQVFPHVLCNLRCILFPFVCNSS